MDAVRCLDCGETRWTLFRRAPARDADDGCATCGGPLMVERRRPGTRPRVPFVERRDIRVPQPPSRLVRT